MWYRHSIPFRKEPPVTLKPAIGTGSLLCGAHQVLIHPLFVALAWTVS